MYPHEGNREPAQPNYLEPLPTTNLPQHPAAPGSPAHPPMPGGYGAQGSYGGQPGGYNDEPGRSTGYGNQPGEYGGRPTGHGAQGGHPGGYGDEPGRSQGGHPGGYGDEHGRSPGHGGQPGGYDSPPSQPATYGSQGGGYSGQPASHGDQGGGYGSQPGQPGGYGQQGGYGAPAGQPDAGTLGRLGFGGASADEDPPPSRRSALLDKPLNLGDLLAAVGALVLVLASFLPFVSYDDAALVKALEGLKVSTWFSAWSGQTFMAPVTWFAILSAVGVLAIAGHRFVRGDDRTVLTFTLPQLQFILAAFPAVTLVGYLIARKGVVFGADYAEALGKVPATAPFGTQLSLSFGGYLMLLAALVAVAGTVLNLLGIERTIPLRRRSKPEPQPRPAPRTDSPFYGAAVPTSGPGAHNIHGAPTSGPGVHGAPTSGPGAHSAPGAPQWDSTRQWESAPSWESADPGPASYEQHTAPYEPDPLTDPSYNQQPRRQTPPGTVYGRPPGQ